MRKNDSKQYIRLQIRFSKIVKMAIIGHFAKALGRLEIGSMRKNDLKQHIRLQITRFSKIVKMAIIGHFAKAIVRQNTKK